MEQYNEILTFLFKIENAFFDCKCQALAEGNAELYQYAIDNIRKVNEMKEFFREQYIN